MTFKEKKAKAKELLANGELAQAKVLIKELKEEAETKAELEATLKEIGAKPAKENLRTKNLRTKNPKKRTNPKRKNLKKKQNQIMKLVKIHQKLKVTNHHQKEENNGV